MNCVKPCAQPCTCGGCEGTRVSTPLPIYNRPGLDAFHYRVGRHGEFLETMKARLHSLYLERIVRYDETGEPVLERSYPLQALKTRDARDFSIALLDAWAVVGDVLSFYQERIATEGYLRTATERRSVLELARLVGYRPRPGVAATAYLAYTLDEGQAVPIPKGSRAQSVPGPGELPQSFETAEDLQAYAELNALKPRLMRPQHLTLETLMDGKRAPGRVTLTRPIYLAGLISTLKTGDHLLFRFDQEVFCRVQEVVLEPPLGRTTVILEPLDPPSFNLRMIAERYLATSPSQSNTARTAEALLATLDTFTPEAEIRAVLERLEGLRRMPSTLSSANLTNWFDGMMRELEQAFILSHAAAPVQLLRQRDEKAFRLGGLVRGLLKPASLPPANALRLEREVSTLYNQDADLIPRLYDALYPQLGALTYRALAQVPARTTAPLRGLEAMRVKAALFGHNIPPTPEIQDGRLTGTMLQATLKGAFGDLHVDENRPLETIALDAEYDRVRPNTTVVVVRPQLQPNADRRAERVTGRVWTYHTVTQVDARTLAADGFPFSARVSLLTLEPPWLQDVADQGDDLSAYYGSAALLRNTTVYAAGEALSLAEEPLTEDICNGGAELIELGGLYQGLEPGRWAIVCGERSDAAIVRAQQKDEGSASGVFGAELLMIAEVRHGLATPAGRIVAADGPEALPGDRLHTFIRFAEPPQYCYKRDTVTIYANVVKATHGETRGEVLGAGNAREVFQTFMLKQPPLTYLAAPTPAGAESTLEVFVNDVQWREAEHFLGLSSTDRGYVLRTDDGGKTSVVFGDGETGARLPTGQENVRATYRSGIGKGGNVAARQVSLLTSRPLGVKAVINPLPATGGAGRESRELARRNAPRQVKALGRLVSVTDYADFAQTFAGIGKASAVALSGRRQLVHVSVAGVDDSSIDKSSDLYRNLARALRELGDPHYPLALELRDLKLLVVKAKVRPLPDYRWETLEPKLRATLLAAFGFERRDFGQDVLQADVLSVLQRVEGVAYADLETLAALGPEDLAAGDLPSRLGRAERIRVRLARFGATGDLLPAQLALLSPAVPDTLILEPL